MKVMCEFFEHIWGLDLSGTLQGAGGVGGLLTEITPDGVRYPFCDGNGNITDWVDGEGGLIAHHEYDPYGNEMTGNVPTSYGFSSKPFDAALGVYYYGYRFYRPDWGRWINRDPLGDYMFFSFYTRNLTLHETTQFRKESLRAEYCFVQNSSTIQIDSYGLAGFCDAFLPGLPSDDYAKGGKNKCYNRECLLDACNDMTQCFLDVAGGIWSDLIACSMGCLPALVFSPSAYASCWAICTGFGTAIGIANCMTEYQGRKEGCEVNNCFCK